MYFVNSMSDLFHESVPDEVIDRVFAVMALCPQHTFQVLTKRSARMREYLAAHDTSKAGDSITNAAFLMNGLVRGYRGQGGSATWPMPNVWLGVSVEDQKRADERIPDLLATPAAVRFLSCEPLLGLVDLTGIMQPGTSYVYQPLRGVRFDPMAPPSYGSDEEETAKIDWVIVGGESGPGARPMHPDWAHSLRDQCAAAGVPFFFKQWGEWAPSFGHPSGTPGRFAMMARVPDGLASTSATYLDHYPRQFISFGSVVLERRSKKAAGRLLDGVTHDAMPQARA